MRYFYFATSLPPLKLGKKPEISFKDFEEELKTNLTKQDLEKCKVIRLWFDLGNILAHLKKERIEVYGNLTEKQIEEALSIHNILPQYVFDFFDAREDLDLQIRDFPALFVAFFQNEIPKATGFLKDFLIFEKEIRLVLLALRAKRGKRDFAKELQFEDVHDPFIANILAQKDQPDYEPPPEFADLKRIWENKRNDPLELSEAVIEYRLKKMEEMTELALFSIDVILAYLVKLILVEQWNNLDEKQGKAVVDLFRKETENQGF